MASEISAKLLSKRRRKDVLVSVKVRTGHFTAADHIITGDGKDETTQN